MHMFVGTHAFVPGHFIYHYTVNYVVAKKKNSAVHWKSHVLKPIAHDVTSKQFNKEENSIKFIKIIAVGIILQIQKSAFF